MKKKILIVDDEPNILMSLEFLMKKKGYEVYIARNGREALEIVEKSFPHLIILDIMMPEVDGYEVCRYVKSKDSLKDIKIIFISAKIKEEEIKKGLDLGAEMYVTKPFSNKDILSKVEGLIKI